jgi:hypothetical protein
MERIDLLRNFDVSQNLQPQQLVRMGLCDPCKLFVKNEPHKKKKLLDGVQRLIFSVSLIDNAIARILHSNQNREEILNWKVIPPSPGLGLDDPGLAAIHEAVTQMELRCGGLMSSDVSGWDFSVQSWELEADLQRRVELNGSKGTDWERIASAHLYCMSRKVFVLSDGSMYQQLLPGLMPSGWYLTASSNSNIRAIDSYHVAIEAGVKPAVKTMGDDSVEAAIPNPIEAYSKLGKVIKFVENVTPSKFEFCSTQFENGIGVPVNIDKQLVNLLSYKPLTYAEGLDRFQQFCYELRHYPQLRDLEKLVLDSGWWDSFPSYEISQAYLNL